jgi:hypothetical protein
MAPTDDRTSKPDQGQTASTNGKALLFRFPRGSSCEELNGQNLPTNSAEEPFLFASSAEFVGKFWLWKVAKCVI